MSRIKFFAAIMTLFVLLEGSVLADCKLRDFMLDDYRISGSGSTRSKAVSATTSSITSSTTYGLAKLSSTSGCGKRGRAHLRQEHFMIHNKVYLLADISRGSGEYLNSFSQLMGCSNEVQGQFADTMQGELEQLIPTTPLHAKAVLTRIHHISAGHPVLSKGCQYAG